MVYGLRNLVDTCNSVNIALNKPAIASTSAPGLPASAAFDGTLCSRWGSYANDPQWIYVDLGARYDLCQVVLKWEVALGKDFKIQVSDDAVNWTTIDSITGNINRDNYLPLQGSGRYVRMYGTARGTTFGYSLWEFEVYGKLSSSNTLCPGGNTILSTNLSGVTYQWQVDTGGGFTDISDDSNYTGTNTPNLQLNNIPSTWYGYEYRCAVDNINCNPVIITFTNTCTGAVDTSWENPVNWSCGEVPDANTDVIINVGTVIVNSNPNIRSLTLGNDVNFTVNPNFIFTINH